jgi:hypothetical protein
LVVVVVGEDLPVLYPEVTPAALVLITVVPVAVEVVPLLAAVVVEQEGAA